jgi:hypothetical protein
MISYIQFRRAVMLKMDIGAGGMGGHMISMIAFLPAKEIVYLTFP